MIAENYLQFLPLQIKMLVGVFVLVLSVGFFSGLTFVDSTTDNKPTGIVENYNGNEDNEDANVMKFRKSNHEMLNIIHTHILSMSIIFLLLGLLVYGVQANRTLVSILMIEPLVSVFVTFSGIYFIWLGYEWMTYVVMISGAFMTVSFVLSVLLILRTLYFPRSTKV